MLDMISNFLTTVDDFVWGIPLIVLILATGLFLTARLRFLQITKLPHAIKNLIANEKSGEEEMCIRDRVQRGYEYLKGFAPETLLNAVLYSMMGYFNGNGKTVWVMLQGLIQTLLVRLPCAYYMSIQPDASLTNIGLAAPISTAVGIVLNVAFFLYLEHAAKRS